MARMPTQWRSAPTESAPPHAGLLSRSGRRGFPREIAWIPRAGMDQESRSTLGRLSENNWDNNWGHLITSREVLVSPPIGNRANCNPSGGIVEALNRSTNSPERVRSSSPPRGVTAQQ
jgi:hypothetical protein